MRALGLVVLAERLRPNAAETVAFFAEQDVELKVLSGDAPATVGAIARDAGVPGSAPALDGEALPSEPAALREAVLAAPAVGRISPEGKRAVVDALAEAGRYVAMVGDGVNDVPALKEARLAIAQGSGAQMARSVADLVLVRDDFAVVPGMVAEGRQILRNIQRVARLFVTKSVFTAVRRAGGGDPDRRPSRCCRASSRSPRRSRSASPPSCSRSRRARARGGRTGSCSRSRASRSRPGWRSGSGSSPATCSPATASTSTCVHSRTVATGIVVACGLAVVMRLEGERGRRRLARRGPVRRDGAAVRCSRSSSRSCATSTSYRHRRLRPSLPGPSALPSASWECSASLRLVRV